MLQPVVLEGVLRSQRMPVLWSHRAGHDDRNVQSHDVIWSYM